MKNTNLAVKLHQPNFEEWDYLATETAKVFNLSKKKLKFEASKNTMLIFRLMMMTFLIVLLLSLISMEVIQQLSNMECIYLLT